MSEEPKITATEKRQPPRVEARRVQLSDLVEDPENARSNDERSVAAIRASLERWGQVEPLLVRPFDGVVIGGNGRLRAMRELGWTEANVYFVDLPEEESRRLAIALNRIPELSEWSVDRLGDALREFEAAGDVAALGFSQDQLAELAGGSPSLFRPVVVSIADLVPHPKNYRSHPEDQIAHLASSIRQHGFFRNIVVARGGVILTGHGVVLAAKSLGRTEVPVVRLDIDPDGPKAIRIMASDNEIARLAENDDRALSDLLRWLADADEFGLDGSGLNREQLAALAMATRPESEIENADAAAEWAGMPGFKPLGDRISLVLAFDSEEDRETLIAKLGLVIAKKTRQTWSAWWPPRDREDLSSFRYTDASPQNAPAISGLHPDP